LTNFADAFECKRCGRQLAAARGSNRQRPPARFSFVSLLIFAAVALLVYYMMGGFEQKMAQINANEANRMAMQKKDPDAGLSRTEYDQKRSGQYGTAVQSSNSLAENQKHNDDVQKAMSAAEGR
jgi:hypothetical protein